MSDNFSDDVCKCVFCEAVYIIQLGPIMIPITRQYLHEVWFKESYFFNRLRDNVKNTKNNRGSIIPYAKN